VKNIPKNQSKVVLKKWPQAFNLFDSALDNYIVHFYIRSITLGFVRILVSFCLKTLTSQISLIETNLVIEIKPLS
jgi:hypothetical protein